MILANENAISSGGNYQITNSLRFQSASSQYLNRTPGTNGNGQTWTLSMWVKRGALTSAVYQLFGARNLGVSSPYTMIDFETSDKLIFYTQSSTLLTTQVFRDVGAWYHLVFVMDTTQATAANRVKIYVNGSQITAFDTATYPAQNFTSSANQTILHLLGAGTTGAGSYTQYFDGEITEINMIDGQALTPSSFGQTDSSSGQWVAAKYTGSYGTNGFYLKFANGTSTTTLGTDSSGNGNNWTLTNFTRSAGVSDCWLIDVPSGNGSGSGTQPSSNYCVLNPLDKSLTATTTVTNSNFNIASTAVNAGAKGTIGVTSGKWYFECVMLTFNVGNTQSMVGVANQNWPNDYLGSTTGTIGYCKDGTIYQNGSTGGTGTPTAYVVNDVLGVAFDAGTGVVSFYKNNVLQYTCNSIGTGYTFFPAISCQINSYAANFGQRSFTYTPPSGFKALCTANLPVATIKQGNKYMDATLYTGNGTSLTVTNAGAFKPDFVWGKRRNITGNNVLINSVAGIAQYLFSDSTAAEATNSTILTSLNSNGFTLGSSGAMNSSTDTFVAWQWQAGQGSTSSNTNGSITSTVSVNATAGFSIVTYTGTGANATVGHGLGVAPKMVIVKKRSSTGNWAVYHSNLTSAAYVAYMNLTNAQASSPTSWNSTAPTSSVFSIGTDTDVNVNATTFVAYCFAEISGFSKFGSYTGNGSTDGPFCYTGFQPKFVMTKRTDTTSDWVIVDTARANYFGNVEKNRLYPNSSIAEDSADTVWDYLSNGFKSRTTNTTTNASGGTYIYMAFATNPFANSNAF